MAEGQPEAGDLRDAFAGRLAPLDRSNVRAPHGRRTHGRALPGGAPAALALMSGEVPLTFGSISDGIEHAKAGKVRILATTGAQRSSYLPKVPTFAESGFQGLVTQDWHTFQLPGGTPGPTVERLNAAVRAAVATPTVQAALNRFPLEPVANSVEDSTHLICIEHERLALIVSALKFTMA
jgi:tripartite-type tricarboxylate transporter receptor subunit TctC